MATLQETISSYRTTQSTGHQGLLAKLSIDGKIYDIKDPAVEELAAAIDTELAEIKGKTWTVVEKGNNDPKFATSVGQAADGSISVTYSNLRDTALTDTATTGQFITSVSQDVNGIVTTTKAGVDAADVSFTPGTGFESTSTNAQAAIEDALAKAMALKGSSSDASSAETIAAAKKYADEKVQQLAGQDWTATAQKVQDIIDELEGSEQATSWATLVDKLKGMSVSEKGTQGQEGYRPANTNPSVVEYVQAAIQDVNAANAEGISALDAVIYGGDGASGASGAAADTAYSGDTTSKVAVKVTEVDGKITVVDVKTNDIASAQVLTTLNNAAVKSVNSKTPTNGAVTLYAGDVNLSSTDNTTIAAKLTTLDTTKANAAYISTGSVNNWGAPTYASETLTWNAVATTVLVPGSGNLTNS